MTVNQSDDPLKNEQILSMYFTIQNVQTKILPVICVLGFVTNLLSFFVFFQPSLKCLSCSVYLAAKAVTDFLFLWTVFIIWSPRVDVNLFHYAGICQIVVFFSYLTAYISIWLAVALTVENLLCVIKPWFVHKSCNAFSAGIITAIITLLGVIFYHFSLWNNGIRSVHKSQEHKIIKEFQNPNFVVNSTSNNLIDEEIYLNFNAHYSFQQMEIVVTNSSTEKPLTPNASTQSGEGRCMPLEEFKQLSIAFTYIDSLITMFIPLFILAVDNTIIVLLALRSTKPRVRFGDQKINYHLPGTHLAKQGNSIKSLKTQASRFLFAVSMTTLVFHLPFHLVRLKSLVFGYNALDLLLQRVFETLYYSHYSIGFFVYIVFGKNFRKVFLQLLSRLFSCETPIACQWPWPLMTEKSAEPLSPATRVARND